MPSVSAAMAQMPPPAIPSESRNSQQRPPRPPFPVIGHRDRALAAGDERSRPGRAPRKRRHLPADLACFAGDGVAQDHGPDSVPLKHLGGGLQRPVSGGDDLVGCLHCLRAFGKGPRKSMRYLASTAFASSTVVGSAAQGPEAICVGSSPITSEMIERHDRRAGGGGEPATGDRREVLAHRVHFLDRRAALQQAAGQRLELGHAYAGRRKRQQARAAAREQREQQIVGPERVAPRESPRPLPRRPHPAPDGRPRPRGCSSSAGRGRSA